MNILEQALSLLAPHVCLSCGKEGEIVCQGCTYSSFVTLPSRCYRCYKITRQFSVCSSCRSSVPLKHVYVAAEYNGLAKDLVKVLKFERAKAAHEVIAVWLDDQLPLIDAATVIVHVPTANSRARMRGYDQSRLVARSLARRRQLEHFDGLERKGSARQVGASRKERLNQLKNAFKVTKIQKLAGKPVLLVDDVLTTGATIEAAAHVLKAAGVKTIDASLFAH